MSTLERRFRRAADVESTAVGDRVVLYHRGSGTALVLNPTGTTVWAALAQPATTQGLASALREKVPALAEADAIEDVSALIDDLRRRGVVTAEE